jgi:hypothetical protein
MIAFVALVALSAASPAADEAKMRTGFLCDLRSDFSAGPDRPKEIKPPRKLAFLMDGADPFTPILTIDPSRVLDGNPVSSLSKTKEDGSTLLGLNGAATASTTKLISLTQGQFGDAQGFDVEIGRRSGGLELGGFCLAIQTMTTVAEFKSQISKFGFVQ